MANEFKVKNGIKFPDNTVQTTAATGGGGAIISDTAPTSPTAGQLWWDSVSGQTYIYYTDADSSQWVPANASQPGPQGIQGIQGIQGPQGEPGEVTLAGTQTLTNKTIEGAVLNNGYTEEVFTITDDTTVNLDPNNGSIQTWTLGANRTPSQANWAAGQSITLMIDDGAARQIVWTTLAPVWETNGGNAPTLALTGFTVIVLWKVGTTLYGARVGDA
jgi:hypothetical protein